MWLNPVAGTPASALETTALLDSLGPSLMPRTSVLQGVAAALTLLAARAVAGSRPLLVSTLSLAGIAVRASRQLVERESVIGRWQVDQRTTLPGVLGTATLTTALGSGLARGFVASRTALTDRLEAAAGVPLQHRRTGGARWRESSQRHHQEPAQ